VAPTLARAWPWLARVGLLRLSDRLSAQARGLPEGDGDAMRAFLNRPDHLTRAAMELSALDDIEGMVPAVSPTTKVPATPVSIGTHSQPAMIVSRADAARVAEAISATVAQVRALESSTSSDR
jgi:hypothetical protein